MTFGPRGRRFRARAGVRLDAILVVTFAAAIVAELTVVPALRFGVEAGVAVVGFGAMLGWVRANRVALDLLQWCACAPSSIRVRVITSERPEEPARQWEFVTIEVGREESDAELAAR